MEIICACGKKFITEDSDFTVPDHNVGQTKCPGSCIRITGGAVDLKTVGEMINELNDQQERRKRHEAFVSIDHDERRGGMSCQDFFVKVDEKNISKEVGRFNGIVALNFWSSWCGQCNHLNKILQMLFPRFKEQVKFCIVDTDKSLKLAKRFTVEHLPTILFFQAGSLVAGDALDLKQPGRLIGLVSKERLEGIFEKLVKKSQ